MQLGLGSMWQLSTHVCMQVNTDRRFIRRHHGIVIWCRTCGCCRCRSDQVLPAATNCDACAGPTAYNETPKNVKRQRHILWQHHDRVKSRHSTLQVSTTVVNGPRVARARCICLKSGVWWKSQREVHLIPEEHEFPYNTVPRGTALCQERAGSVQPFWHNTGVTTHRHVPI